MEVNHLVSTLKEKGSISFKASSGEVIRWDLVSSVNGSYEADGVFLIHELYQLRGIAKPFSEVSLDIVEWSEDPVIFHTDAGPLLLGEPFSGRIIKFALIKDPYWKNLLKRIGGTVYSTYRTDLDGDFIIREPFPLCKGNVKEIYLSAEGQVKMIGK